MRLRVTFEKQFVPTSILCALLALTASCAKRAHRVATSNTFVAPASTVGAEPAISPLDINSASASELEKLPGVGQAIARRIVEHRERYGFFRRPEHLIIVRGISERRFKLMRPFITTGE